MSEVLFSPVTAINENRPPASIVLGAPGSGKSYAMVNMCAAAIEQSCGIFVLDAKNDMQVLKNISPDIQLIDVNQIVDSRSSSAHGSLDPFICIKDLDAPMLITIVDTLCGGLSQDQQTELVPIVGDFINRSRHSRNTTTSTTFRDFVDYLYQHQNNSVRNIGTQLMMHEQTRYGKLIFNDQGKRARALSFTADKNRVISIHGMPLPVGNAKPKADELLSATVVYILCKMMKNLMKSKKKFNGEVDKRPTVLFLDECHILMKSQAIKGVIDELLVLGRSLGVAVVMASQNVTHFDPNIAQYVSSKFSFKMSKAEAAEFFNMFNNTTSENELDVQECIETTTRLKTGYCFYIDSKERCSLMHVESIYDTSKITSNPLEKTLR